LWAKQEDDNGEGEVVPPNAVTVPVQRGSDILDDEVATMFCKGKRADIFLGVVGKKESFFLIYPYLLFLTKKKNKYEYIEAKNLKNTTYFTQMPFFICFF